ncbi:MAG: glycosyltransferase [Synechococcales cyanobacterium CRU_2_2]|nr:glycosyltransferase [Synechococcales cyanobacterium CRU_2_2]
MPLISIIIPAFNATETIQETVKSVLNQTLDDFELIIINSATASNRLQTRKILQDFKDSRIKIFDHDEANASVNRNRGIVQASAPLIAFLDADDLWTPRKLELQYQALQANPSAAVAYSATECIDETSRFCGGGQRPCGAVMFTGSYWSTTLSSAARMCWYGQKRLPPSAPSTKPCPTPRTTTFGCGLPSTTTLSLSTKSRCATEFRPAPFRSTF